MVIIKRFNWVLSPRMKWVLNGEEARVCLFPQKVNLFVLQEAQFHNSL